MELKLSDELFERTRQLANVLMRELYNIRYSVLPKDSSIIWEEIPRAQSALENIKTCIKKAEEDYRRLHE